METGAEKRRYPRFDSLNLSYLVIDEAGATVKQSMGRTLNVSESGICLETHFPTNNNQQMMLTIALENDLVEVKGKVVYCRPGADELYETGVEFAEMEEKTRKILGRFITLFQEGTGD